MNEMKHFPLIVEPYYESSSFSSPDPQGKKLDCLDSIENSQKNQQFLTQLCP